MGHLSHFFAALTTGTAIVTVRLFALQTNLPPDGSPQEEFLKWGMKESALFVVIVTILYFYRRDFLRKVSEREEQSAQLLRIVETNTTAMVELRGTTSRLARAVENNNVRHRAHDAGGLEG